MSEFIANSQITNLYEQKQTCESFFLSERFFMFKLQYK